MKLGDSLRAGLLTGLLAGIVLSLFSLVFTTPLIDRAIEFEASTPEARPEAFSRGIMKFGMVVGFLIYGIIMGLLFGAVFSLLKDILPGKKEKDKSLILSFLAYWSLAFLPFLKYPANPPGVGGEETISFRQATYAGFIALSLLLTMAGVAWYKYMASAGKWRWPLTLIGYWLLAALAYFLMPAHPASPTQLPSGLLWGFRALSLAGLTLFWLSLGLAFIFLKDKLTKEKRPAPAKEHIPIDEL